MRHILIFVAALMSLFASCGGDNGPSREDFAAKAAKADDDRRVGGGVCFLCAGV